MTTANTMKKTTSRTRKRTKSSKSSWRFPKRTEWMGKMGSYISTLMTSMSKRNKCWSNTCRKNTIRIQILSSSRRRSSRS